MGEYAREGDACDEKKREEKKRKSVREGRR
jgi:hypothetical protein